jgi:hypothetical protein
MDFVSHEKHLLETQSKYFLRLEKLNSRKYGILILNKNKIRELQRIFFKQLENLKNEF